MKIDFSLLPKMWIIWHLESTLFLLDKDDALFRIFASATRRIFGGFSELVPGYAKFYIIHFIFFIEFLLFNNPFCGTDANS